MNNIKYFPLIHPSEKYVDIKNSIRSNTDKVDFLTSDIERADCILVLWWDGYMLESIKKYADYNKPFIGINCGTLWFLMNNISDIHDLPKTIDKRDILRAKFIKAKIWFENGDSVVWYAANDICIWNSLFDYYNLSIEPQTWDRIDLKWTWVVVSNNFWSTSYRLSLWWPLIPTSSDLLGIIWVWSLPFRFKLYKPQDIKIDVDGKSKCKAAFDWHGLVYDDVKYIQILPSDKTYDIWFLHTNHIENKRVLMTEMKIWSN